MNSIHNLFLTVAALAACGACFAAAQGYPTKPVRLVIPSAPGGGTDLIARYLAQAMSEQWSQTVITDNRSGGATTIGISIAAKSPADGYTLLLTTVNFAYLPAIHPKLPYDPVKDFVPVVRLATSDSMITVQKGEEKFEIARSPATKVDGTLAVGNRVTVHYRMSAESVNVKASPSTEKADKAARKAADKVEKKVSK